MAFVKATCYRSSAVSQQRIVGFRRLDEEELTDEVIGSYVANKAGFSV